MTPFFLTFLLFVPVALGTEYLDCSCMARENDYRIVGGELSVGWFSGNHLPDGVQISL